ncbi:MAG TPA: cyanophycinase [Ignavibacteriales bacterium]|nr:cyanophycinase [Ignavibacteriales bacterium]
MELTGHLIALGGGRRPDNIIKKFIELAGGDRAKLAIVALASDFPAEAAKNINDQLKSLGHSGAEVIDRFNGRVDCERNIEKLERVTGIFFTGGDQDILTAALSHTKTLELIKNIYSNGGVIAGASAGAAAMSKVMLASRGMQNDSSQLSPRPKTPEKGFLSKGFGFFENAIIDQHFNTRDRRKRLIEAVMKRPELLGIGIDEATAIWVHPDRSFEVMGDYSVNVFKLKPNCDLPEAPAEIENIILRSGDKYPVKN